MPGGPIVDETALQQKKLLQDEPLVEYVLEDDDEDHGDDNSDQSDDNDDNEANESSKLISRSERKSRKAAPKLGMKPVVDVSRVIIQRTENALFSISKPDVFKSSNSDTYVIFGEFKMEDVNSQLRAQTEAAQQLMMPDTNSLLAANLAASSRADEEEEDQEDIDETGVEPRDIYMVEPRDIDMVMTQTDDDENEDEDDDENEDEDDDDDEDEDEEEEEEEEDIDETGVDPQDIGLVMAQTNVSRSRAVLALKIHGGDLVSAIMDLTIL